MGNAIFYDLGRQERDKVIYTMDEWRQLVVHDDQLEAELKQTNKMLREYVEGYSAQEEEVDQLEDDKAALIKHGHFTSYEGRCEHFLRCRICKGTWEWEIESPKHKEHCPLREKNNDEVPD